MYLWAEAHLSSLNPYFVPKISTAKQFWVFEASSGWFAAHLNKFIIIYCIFASWGNSNFAVFGRRGFPGPIPKVPSLPSSVPLVQNTSSLIKLELSKDGVIFVYFKKKFTAHDFDQVLVNVILVEVQELQTNLATSGIRLQVLVFTKDYLS